jgi:hypothetical protein
MTVSVEDLDGLIHQRSGRMNLKRIREKGMLRAQREYGGPNPPPSWVRDGENWWRDRAEIIQRRWRAANGLPNETVTVNMPSWGASGDSFR